MDKIISLDSSKRADNNLSSSTSDQEDMYKKERFIVMELLRPLVSDNYIISPKSQQQSLYAKLGDEYLKKIQITNEVGVYGVQVRYEP